MTYHSPILACDAPATFSPPSGDTVAERRVASDLAALAAGMDVRFVDAGKTLMMSIETIDRLIAILKEISGALDGDAVDDAVATLTGMAERLGSLPDTLVMREADLSAARANSAMLDGRVEEVNRFFDVLQIYGMNTKIAAGGEDEFVRFVTDIDGRVDDGRTDIREIADMLKDLAPSLSQAAQTVEPLRSECARIVPAVPERLAENALVLRGHMNAMGALAGDVLTIAREIQGEVALVLGALQEGDSTRQRIEHVVDALAILEAHRVRIAAETGIETVKAVEAHVFGLLTDHLEAAAGDFVGGTTTLLGSLNGIGPHAARLLSLIEGQAATGPESTGQSSILQNVEQNIVEMEELTNRLHHTDLQSNQLVEKVAQTLIQLSEKLKVFADLRIDVRNIAMNTLVLCRRMGDTGRAVLVIAKEIDRICSDLGTVLDGMIELVEKLSVNSVSIQATTDKGTRPDLADALAIVRQGCDSNDNGIEQGRNEAKALIELLERTGSELSEELALERQMLAASETLAALSPTGQAGEADLSPQATEAIAAILAEIAKLYSMAQEREVHQRHVLPGMADDLAATNPTDPFALDDDEDDDGLF